MRLLTGAVFLLILSALAAAAAPLGIADLSAFSARASLLRPEPKLAPEAQQERWIRGRNALLRAIALDSRNPNHYENLAIWYERAALRMPARHPVAEAYLRQALAYARTAIVARPGSPYTWMDLAVLKWRLGEFDPELQQAVRNAAHLGPWEPEVQLAAAGLAFTAYERLSPEARQAALRLMGNALKYHDERLFDQAYRTGRLDIFCAIPGVAASRHAVRCI